LYPKQVNHCTFLTTKESRHHSNYSIFIRQ